MFFKNARLFTLMEDFTYKQDELETQLSEQVFVPCSSYEKSRLGWVSPLGNARDGDEAPMLSHVIGDFIILCAQKQDRLLPASVVREATEEKVEEIEARQGRKIYRKEKRQIQEDVFAQLLPRAFTRSQKTYAYIDTSERLLVVDSSSAPRAEDLVNLLRDSLDSFPVALPASRRAPADVMTQWLKSQKATNQFRLHEDLVMHNPLDSSNVVRCKGQDLISEEIGVHLEAGKQAKSLGVTWNNVLACVLEDDLSVKRLQFDSIEEERESFEEESAAQKFDQECALMTLELRSFFEALFKAFGGLDEPRPLGRKSDKDSL